MVVDAFDGSVGVVIDSVNGLVRLQYPNGYSWKAFAFNLRQPGAVELERYEAAERKWSAWLGPTDRGGRAF
ncbi:hypothetical protein ABZ502_19660 [Streptomyces abikoensis]|uniref:hypothetical protein n=1 Tax=Streptomyces abikoensis TaxID=97398 RepID=UPI0033FFB087